MFAVPTVPWYELCIKHCRTYSDYPVTYNTTYSYIIEVPTVCLTS